MCWLRVHSSLVTSSSVLQNSCQLWQTSHSQIQSNSTIFLAQPGVVRCFRLNCSNVAAHAPKPRPGDWFPHLRCARNRSPRRTTEELWPSRRCCRRLCLKMQALQAQALHVPTFHAARPLTTRTRRVAGRCTRPMCAAAVGKHFVVVWHRLDGSLLNFRHVHNE